MTFSDWIAEELKTRDMSQRQLAERAGIAQGHLSNVLSGKRPMTADLVIQIADGLGISAVTALSRAGIILDTTNLDPPLAELLAAAKGLTAEQIQEVIRFARFLRK